MFDDAQQGAGAGHGGLFAQREALTTVARGMLAQLPQDAVRIVFSGNYLAGYSKYRMQAFDAAGTPQFLEPDETVSRGVKQLREVMYRDGQGTWFSTQISVDRAGRVETSFNYDDEPEWSFNLVPPAGEFQYDLKIYPRNEDAIPDWLRRRRDDVRDEPMAPGPGSEA